MFATGCWVSRPSRFGPYIASGQGLDTIGLVNEGGLAFGIFLTLYNYLVEGPSFLVLY